MPEFPQRQVAELTDSNFEIMRQLAHYRYLTPSQMVALGITTHRNNLYPILRRFQVFRRPVVEAGKFSRTYGGDKRGREALEAVYYLNERGVQLLQEIDPDTETEYRHIRTKAVASRDYDHRRETVDFHILVDQFAALYGCTVDCFHVYFDHTGANNSPSGIAALRRNTTVEYDCHDAYGTPVETRKFSPDAIFHLTDPVQKGHFFAVEIQRGMDTKRLHRKLRDDYIPALGEGALSTAYGVRRVPTVLVVCENESLATHTLDRLNDDPAFEGFEDCFAFHTIEALRGFKRGACPPSRITREARAAMAEILQGRDNWRELIADSPAYANEPKRLALGWRYMRGKTKGIF